jgi:hypothetical protein
MAPPIFFRDTSCGVLYHARVLGSARTRYVLGGEPPL